MRTVLRRPPTPPTAARPARAGLCAAALALLCSVAGAADAPVRLDHEQAVRAAREGRLDEAIAALERLEAAGDLAARQDLVVVLVWAGQTRRAVELFERLGPGAAPDHVNRAAAAAYRAQRRLAEAECLARAGVDARPDDAEWVRLLSGILVDSARSAEAVALMSRQIARQPDDAEHWVALGNAARAAAEAASKSVAGPSAGVPDLFMALRAYLQAGRLRPGHADAAAGAASVLSRLGAPYGAAAQLQAVPLALRVDQAGRQLRWATQLDAPSPARRFEAVDAALAGIDLLLAEVEATPGADPALAVALRRDRVVALRQRERWAETLAAVAALRADGIAVPAFVRQAEADALLALRQPEAARIAYDEVLAADPGQREATVGRFFAEVESEDFRTAFATIDALAASEPEARQLPRDPVPRPNPEWLDARILAASARSWADMQAEAWERMTPLADGAPALGYLRSAQSAVAAARGWPRRADEQIHIAASLAPEDRGIQVGLADSAMRRQRWPEARERVAALQAVSPEDASVQRAARDLAAHDRAELETGIVLRSETGDAQYAPGSGIDAYLRLYSPPLAELWRLMVAAERMTAAPPEGDAVRNRYGIGAQYRGPDVRLDATAWANEGTLQQGGFALAGAWTPDDHVWLGAEAQRFAADTPLRALLYGITANAVGASGSYTWNESASASVALRALDFSDGNRRRSIVVGGAWRMMAEPQLKIDLRPGLYASTNSLDGAPYFNPSRDRQVSLAVEADHLTWRRYERSFSQHLVATLGSYWQQGYGAGVVGGLRYAQVWRHDPLTELRYGVEVHRALYDGVAERDVLLFATLNHRF